MSTTKHVKAKCHPARAHVAHGLCEQCYRRVRRHPEAARTMAPQPDNDDDWFAHAKAHRTYPEVAGIPVPIAVPAPDPLEAARASRVQAAADSRDRVALKASLARLEVLEAQVEHLTADFAKPSRPVERVRIAGNRHPATLLAALSDVHGGAEFPETPVTFGNKYSPEICQLRLAKYFAGVEWKVQAYRSGKHGEAYDVHHIKVWLGGDMFDGHLHEDQQETSQTAIRTGIWLEPALVDGFKRLQGIGVDVSIECSFGNHGRDNRKMSFVTGADHNHEWGMYMRLARQLPGIDVSCTTDEFQFWEIYGRKFCGHHGHRISYGGGVGGIWIPANKAIAKWQESVPCYHYLFGHYHSLQHGPHGTFNGSIVGYNPFARGIKGTPERPQQAAMLIDEEHGIVDNTRIWVVDKAAEAGL